MAADWARRIAALMVCLAPAMAFADRVLIERAPYQVSLPEQSCAAQQTIRVVADAHQHLGYDNSDLEAIVRRAHAAVWLSCAKVHTLCVEAYLKGSDIRVMNAVASRENNFDLKIAEHDSCTAQQADEAQQDEATGVSESPATLEELIDKAKQADPDALHELAQHYQDNPQQAVADEVLDELTGRPEQIERLQREEKIALLEMLAAREGSGDALTAIREDSLQGEAAADYALGRLYAGDRQAKLPMDDAFLEQEMQIASAKDRQHRASVAAYFFSEAAGKGDTVSQQVAELAGLEDAQATEAQSGKGEPAESDDVERGDQQNAGDGGPAENQQGEASGVDVGAEGDEEQQPGNAANGRALEAGPVPGDALRPGPFGEMSQERAREVVELALMPVPTPQDETVESENGGAQSDSADAADQAASSANGQATSGGQQPPVPAQGQADDQPINEPVPVEQHEGELIID